MLRDSPDRLAADLRRFYGVKLSDVRTGKEDVLEVAAYAANLPRGGAVGEWYGGALAITSETEGLWELAYILAQVNSKKRINPREMPKGVREVERKQDRAALMAAKYRRKHGGGSHG